MIETHEFLVRARLDVDALKTCIESGWLIPQADDDWRFAEVDLARAQLIRDLREDLGVNDEGIGIALDLVDQVHGLRRTLLMLLSALGAQPEEVRRGIVGAIGAASPDGTRDPPSGGFRRED